MIQSLTFWAVVALSVPLFWLLPRRIRFGWLALVSFAYLFTLQPVHATTLAAISLAFFLLAWRPTRGGKPWITTALVVALLGYLAFYKYVPPIFGLSDSVLVPLGISFFTFKLIHYAVEVGRGHITDRSIQLFFAYVFLFPIFTAGPIERFDHFLTNQDERWQVETTVEGLTRIIHGLIKRFFLIEMIVAPRFGPVDSAAALAANLDGLGPHQVWKYLVLTFLVLYLDFSAYSDIAIGISRLFGLRIMENFDWPLLAPNIRAFWARWHMSLVGWVQAYVYMPLIGLTRSPHLAVFATFVTIGLWHGGSLSWLCWGLYHAAGVSSYLTWKRWQRLGKVPSLGWPVLKYAGIAATFAFVSFGGVFRVMGETSIGVAARTAAKALLIDLVF